MATYGPSTRIISTLGPASGSPEMVRRLIRAGADCFRLNFSHGDGHSMAPLLEIVRTVSREEDVFIPVLADIQGPKIRVGKLPGDGVLLREGAEFEIRSAPDETSSDSDASDPEEGAASVGDESGVDTTYPYLTRDLEPGARVLLADGIIELEVMELGQASVRCRVLIGGRLFSNKGMNLPGARLSVETLTDKDRRDLEFIANADYDMAAISFVRSARDMERAREILGKRKLPLMAKLERPEAMDNLDEILEASDGVMIARGDLGVEVPFERVPLLQKQIIERAAVRGKWVVVATQMLGSMVRHSRPSRAEVSDVANAVIDGADALMLSEETAVGSHPDLAVEAMARIAREAGARAGAYDPAFEADILSFAAGAAGAAVSAAERIKASAIVTLAGSGLTALLVSKWRPERGIIALSAHPRTLRRLNVLRGVTPVAIGEHFDMETQIRRADDYLLEAGLVRPGDRIVVVAAVPLGKGAETNTVRFHRVRPPESEPETR